MRISVRSKNAQCNVIVNNPSCPALEEECVCVCVCICVCGRVRAHMCKHVHA